MDEIHKVLVGNSRIRLDQANTNCRPGYAARSYLTRCADKEKVSFAIKLRASPASGGADKEILALDKDFSSNHYL